MKITKPGFYEITMDQYLRDPCPEPALSSTIVELLYSSTPQRAHLAHPRFNPASVDTSPRADKGSAVHALAHGGYPLRYVESVAKRSGKDKGVSFVPTDWKTDDAKEAANEIRAAGGIPLLLKDRAGIEAAGAAAKSALSELGAGKHEQTMIFQIDGVWCRSRADFLTDGAVIRPALEIDAPNGVDADTKTVDIADAVSWIKSTLFNGNLLAQVGLRHLGHIALTGKPRKMLWLLQEYEAPFDNCWVGASDEVIELAVRKVKHAARAWSRCLEAKAWPANRRRVSWAAPATWAIWDAESRGVE